MSDALLTALDLTAGFGSNQVLHGVSFDVHEGEFACILGLNGAGKSVTMKVIGGIVPAWTGTLRFKARDITHMSPEERVESGMAHVPQGRQVFPELTVEQNLRLGGYTLRKRDTPKYGQILETVYDRFAILGQRRTQAAGLLSGGEQAMLAVGRALLSDPTLILVDEASAGLSPVMVQEVGHALKAVNDDGVTILMVEQNVSFALQVSDTARIMQSGTIVYEGDVPSLDRQRVSELLGVGRLLGGHIQGSTTGAKAKKPQS